MVVHFRHASSALIFLLGSVATCLPPALSHAQLPSLTNQQRNFACTAKYTADRSAQGKQVMVAASHPSASTAGCRVLLEGGTAADAVVAVQAVLSVVEPQSSGMAGGSLLLYYDRSTGETRSFDGLAAAPQRVTNCLRTPHASEQQKLGKRSSFGSFVNATGRAVGVPGTVAVLDMIHRRYGRKAWHQLFDVGIELAQQGFHVSSYLHDIMSAPASDLPRCAYPDLNARYCTGNRPRPVGAPVTNQPLAKVLRWIRDEGASGFYDPDGWIVQAIIERATRDNYKLTRRDGKPAIIPSLLTPKDFAAYQPVERPVLCEQVLGKTICTSPPPSFGGFAVVYQLGIMERGNVSNTRAGSLERVHLGIEASRLAQFDRRTHVGDPSYSKAKPLSLLRPDYLDTRFAQFSPASSVQLLSQADTTADASTAEASTAEASTTENDYTSHISIVDSYGNAISMTTTVNTPFGAQMEATGMILNNVQTNFTRLNAISPGRTVNQMEPSKRPRTSMAPTMVFNEHGELELVVGAAGGGAIPDYVVQTILGVVVDALDPQSAMSQPHWSGQSIASLCTGGVSPCSEIEKGTSNEELLDDLKTLGHRCACTTELRSGITAIQVQKGRLLGASDPRRDGIARGF
ncbi:MAG: gamma-glutamyltransferase [Myxococcales bacterium]|nr:gamma-glutamyltransferase [Myxococcales bacterium]